MPEPVRAARTFAWTIAGLAAVAGAASALPPATPAWRALTAGAPPAPGWLAATPSGTGPTAVLRNVAGWDAPDKKPSNRSSAIAVSPDGRRVAIAWLHNGPPGGPTGEPSLWGTTGDLARFTGPVLIGVRPFAYVGAPAAEARYNGAHNAPFVAADRHGGFIAIGLGMNANGYAQNQNGTGYGYVVSGVESGGTRWRTPSLARLRSLPLGSSLSEMSGGVGPDGTLHVVGQGHLGQFQGGFGYQRFRPWTDAWDSAVLAAPYRVRGGPTYFVEGAGVVGTGTAGRGAVHVAFAWNRHGATPNFGLYYLMSPDGGASWRNADGRVVVPPLRMGASDDAGAIVSAGLARGAATGALPGVHGLAIALAPDGQPLILKPASLPGDPNRAQVMLYARVKGRWVSAPVGTPIYWNFGGTGLTINAKTGMVDAVVLDPGNPRRAAQVIVYSAPLAQVRRGAVTWRRQVVAEARNSHGYASSLQVAFAPNQKAVFLFEPDYHNPGQVSPVLGTAVLP